MALPTATARLPDHKRSDVPENQPLSTGRLQSSMENRLVFGEGCCRESCLDRVVPLDIGGLELLQGDDPEP